MSSCDLDGLAGRLADCLDADDPGELADEPRRRLLTALVRDFARAGGSGSPIAADQVTAGEVAVTVAAMMRAAEVTSFEVAALFDV